MFMNHQLYLGQLKRHDVGGEWEKLVHSQLTPYQYQKFLRKVSGVQKADQQNVFSNKSNVSDILHKTAIGGSIS